MLGAKTNTAQRPWRFQIGAKFYRKVFHRYFVLMKLGRLNVFLPDGGFWSYGSGKGAVEANIRVRNEQFFRKCFFSGDVGFGEAYVDKDWDTEDVVKVIEWMIVNAHNHPTLMADEPKRTPVNYFKIFNNVYQWLRANTVAGSQRNIRAHYDLSNEFFQLFLDQTMAYSSAYFRHQQQTLEEAQNEKFERLGRKLQLKPTDHLLEIGSGWGGLAMYAARNFGSRVTTITVSQQQFEYVKQKIQQEGLAHKIDIQLADYRRIKGKYDKIVSVEMIEAVGHRFLKTFFAQCHALLKENGLLGLQMILAPDHRYESFRKNVDWIQKYIFPGSLLPSLAVIHQALNQTGTLNLFHYEDITAHYVKTLAFWREKFNAQGEKVRALGFNEAFQRKWNYYLSYCEAAFKTRNISVAQAVFTRPNNFSIE